MKILISIILLPLFAIGQTTYTGTVFNKNSASSVPYATVGLMKENIGVNADEHGYFMLKSISSTLNDTLVISCVGFITQKIAMTNNSGLNIAVQLAEQVTTLREVFIIPNHNWTSSTLNDFSDCGNSFVGSSGHLQQVAQHFIAPKGNSRLTKVKICRGPGKPRHALFRIRVYDIDTLTRGPGENLCDKIIEVKSKNSSVKVNVEEYKINIPNKDFFVAIEWMKITYNEQDLKHKNDSIGIKYMMYAPVIGWQDIDDSKQEAWQLNYNSIWRPLAYSFKNKKNILIAATIKY